MCRDPGSNWGPIPLQGSALPTELSRQFGMAIIPKNTNKINLFFNGFFVTEV